MVMGVCTSSDSSSAQNFKSVRFPLNTPYHAASFVPKPQLCLPLRVGSSYWPYNLVACHAVLMPQAQPSFICQQCVVLDCHTFFRHDSKRNPKPKTMPISMFCFLVKPGHFFTIKLYPITCEGGMSK